MIELKNFTIVARQKSVGKRRLENVKEAEKHSKSLV